MSKLRFAVILPIGMTLTFVLVALLQDHMGAQLSSKREYSAASVVASAYFGLNAPAVLVEQACKTIFPIDRIDEPPLSVFSVGVERLIFLAGVIGVWFVVGLSLDRRRYHQTAHRKMTFWRALRMFAVLILALALFGGGLYL
jgi:uncharacterized membrane protein YdcZ (DUF606 family)